MHALLTLLFTLPAHAFGGNLNCMPAVLQYVTEHLEHSVSEGSLTARALGSNFEPRVVPLPNARFGEFRIRDIFKNSYALAIELSQVGGRSASRCLLNTNVSIENYRSCRVQEDHSPVYSLTSEIALSEPHRGQCQLY